MKIDKPVKVWCVPVPPEGNFLYKEEKLVYEGYTRDGAVEWIYFVKCDEPAPDAGDFRRYEIRYDL